MYKQDVPAITAHGLGSPEGLVDVITFVLCTIRQPLQQMKAQMSDIRAEGSQSRFLFGHKRAGFVYATEHKEVLFAAVSKGVEIGDVVGTIDVLMTVPNLGMVKAAFVAQCLGMDVACLDTHNLKRLGMPESAVKVSAKLKTATRIAKIKAYVALTRKTGGTEYWWNTWCEYVADRRGSPLKTGEEVSRFHTEAVLGIA